LDGTIREFESRVKQQQAALEAVNCPFAGLHY
jgi:hypothetical protein